MYVIINVFIVYYLVLMIVYDHYISKSQNKFKIFLYKSIYPIAQMLGLWHSWAMFSRPFTYNYNIYARIEFLDGTEEILEVFDSQSKKFMSSISTDVFTEKFLENLLLEPKEGGIRNGFCYYLYENTKNKKNIKKIVLMRETISMNGFDNERVVPYKAAEDYYTMRAKNND